jgi:hypothetical protein
MVFPAPLRMLLIQMPLGCRPGAFFIFRCRWDKRTINDKFSQEILKAKNPRHENDEGSSMFFHNSLNRKQLV